VAPVKLRQAAGEWAANCFLKGLGERKKMPLINIVIALIVVGVALWLINNYIPMAGSIKTILNVVVVVAVAIWVLQAVGMWGRITSYKF
jgi:predicted membrane protein